MILGVPILICLTLPLGAEPNPNANANANAKETAITNIEQITFGSMGFIKAGEAYFSPDHKTIIFQATPIGKTEYQIYTMDLRTRAPKMVSTGKGACTCGFFRPDGRKIIFASSHLRPESAEHKPTADSDEYSWEFDNYMDIFEANVDGSKRRRLTTAPGYDAEGAYSPDGRHIVFTSQRDGDLEVYIMDADGKNKRRITHGKGYDGGPFISPDGKTILYRGDRRNDGEMDLQLRVVGIDGKGDHALTDNALFNWCPYFHPSGQCFIFTQANHRGRPNYDLHMMTLDGKYTTRITFDEAFDGLPVFSADGKRLMWTSKRGGLDESQVFLADFRLPEVFAKQDP